MNAGKTDVSIVLFQIRWSEFAAVLAQLAQCSGEFRTLRFLLSGSNAERERLAKELATNGLSAQAEVTHRYDNLGFAGGHNLLLERSFSDGAPSCLVLNPDVFVEAGAITELTARAHRHRSGLVGPSLSATQHGVKVVDSLGISWTAAGRHIDRDQGAPWRIAPGCISEQAGLTGACLLVDRVAFRQVLSRSGHFFDDYFLAYREDAELGVRAAALGTPSFLVEMEGFSHHRAVRGSQRGNRTADFLGVRNRFLLRWKLGSLRPGAFALPTIRDVVVVVASLSVERRSLPALTAAFQIRRAMIGRRRRSRVVLGGAPPVRELTGSEDRKG